MQPITGQYECIHRSGVGLDYFTSRLDRLTLQASGRFSLSTQDRSRLSHAAKSLLSGQGKDALSGVSGVPTAAPETRREGNYTLQGNTIMLYFDDGTQEQGQVSRDSKSTQIEIDSRLFDKVSDSTLLPPTHRVKKDMEDIAKGLKIAGTIGGMAMKAAKTIHDTLQSGQGTDSAQPQSPAPPSTPAQSKAPPSPQRKPPAPASARSATPVYTPPPGRVPPQPPVSPVSPAPTQSDVETLYCDQCGTRARPGKRFCHACGAQLP